jgi:hypothetical protein
MVRAFTRGTGNSISLLHQIVVVTSKTCSRSRHVLHRLVVRQAMMSEGGMHHVRRYPMQSAIDAARERGCVCVSEGDSVVKFDCGSGVEILRF